MALVSSVVAAVAVAVVVVVELSGPEMLPCPWTSHFDFSERLKKHIFDRKCLAQWLSGGHALFWCRVLIRGDLFARRRSNQ